MESLQHTQYTPFDADIANKRIVNVQHIIHFTFTGKDPRKGWRIPLNEIKYNEQRDEEKEGSGGPFASERGDEPRSGIPNGSAYSCTHFGARYMDHKLMTMWLSVDPMADKYPSISPYAYCAWNPVKLVDPDGRKIDSASVTQEIKDLINPLHTSYNEEFAAVYQALEADQSVTYRFERWDEFHVNKNKQATSGGTSLAEDRAVVIGYTWGLETKINKENAPSRALCEEIRHAKQFCDGEWGFVMNRGLSWTICGNVDEEEAHAWAARVSGSTSRYSLSYYDSDKFAPSAEQAWVNDYKDKRVGTTPEYDANGLYSGEFWFFKQPKK